MSPDRPRVFVSFSHGDREPVRRLIARLEAQPLDLWNYADEAQEIPGGDDLAVHLMEQINRSDAVVPLLTASSFASRYTRLEVRHALVRRREAAIRIVPLVTPACRDVSTWPEPYSDLAELRHRAVDLESRQWVEDALLALCADLGVRYLPLPFMDPRLPFMDRFVTEVQDQIPRRQERENAVYSHLMQILMEFEEAFKGGDHPRALERISFFVMTCEYHFPAHHPKAGLYYPCVVQAIAQISCGRLLAARQTLEALLNHPRLDENVFGALGHIQHQQGLYRQALDSYREASRRDPSDAAARTGVILNAILCGERVDSAAAFGTIDAASIPDPRDRVKVRTVQAYALAASRRFREAAAILADLVEGGYATTDILVNLAHALNNSGRTREARDLLNRFADQFPEEKLLHLRAALSFQLRDHRSAVIQFLDLVGRFPHVRQYRFDAAQACWAAGDRARAQQLCSPLLDPTAFPLPTAAEEFYFDGFANWLLGRPERAEYDFERSRMPPDRHYRRLLALLERR